MKLRCNTIEFNGEKAIINSYSFDPMLDKSMNAQLELFKNAYPNAIVKNEVIDEMTVIDMVRKTRLHGPECHTIGKRSQ